LAPLSGGGGAATCTGISRVEAERVDAAPTRLAAVAVLAGRRAEDAGGEWRNLHRGEQFQSGTRLPNEHGAVTCQEWAVRPRRIASVGVEMDRVTGETRVQCWVGYLTRHRRCVEGKRVGGGEKGRRRV
jgi:hypothetical protein